MGEKITSIDDLSVILVQSGKERSDTFGSEFLRVGIPQRCLRITGGCLIAEHLHYGLKNIEDALAGRSPDGSPKPKYGGYLLYGPTRLLLKENTDVILPGITEIATNIKGDCPDTVSLGIMARPETMWYKPGVGLVVGFGEQDKHLTVLHPDVKANLIMQESVDVTLRRPNDPPIGPWHAEFLECHRRCSVLNTRGWAVGMLVYNGGETILNPDGTTKKEGIVESEIRLWAETNLPVVLVRGSGRVCDKLSEDKRFLEEYPHVRVAENDAESIRKELQRIGMLG